MEDKKKKNTAEEKTAEKKTDEVKISETEAALIKENENLINELEEAKKSADEYKDKWMRNVAEFDNYKKRNAKIWQDAYGEGKAEVILKILPVGDHLSMANSLELDDKTAEGVRLIKRKFEETLKGMDVEEINPVGEKFNPDIAEAIMQVDKNEGEESDVIKQVFEKGYKIKDKIIRYAKVSVIK